MAWKVFIEQILLFKDFLEVRKQRVLEVEITARLSTLLQAGAWYPRDLHMHAVMTVRKEWGQQEAGLQGYKVSDYPCAAFLWNLTLTLMEWEFIGECWEEMCLFYEHKIGIDQCE